MSPTLEEIFEISSAIGALLAAIFSAIGAAAASKSANAAVASVNEAYKFRRATLSPKLVAEAQFSSITICLPALDVTSETNLSLEFDAQERTFSVDPIISISNVSQVPLYELSMTIHFEDHNGNLEIPEDFAGSKLRLHLSDSEDDMTKTPSILTRWTGSSTGMVFVRRWQKEYFPAQKPGDTLAVRITTQIMAYLFIRGLQNWRVRHNGGVWSPIKMKLDIHGVTVENDEFRFSFEYLVETQCSFPSEPLIVHASFRPVPIRLPERRRKPWYESER